MNKTIVYILLAIAVIGLIAFTIVNSQTDTNENMSEELEHSNVVNSDNNDPGVDDFVADDPRYVEYSPQLFESHQDKKRVYFFHATWCPTCKQANVEFEENLSTIPQDVVLFKTDYDSQTDLKKKFGITYQHTFVYVDENGEEIKKWNGGAVDELIANTQ